MYGGNTIRPTRGLRSHSWGGGMLTMLKKATLCLLWVVPVAALVLVIGSPLNAQSVTGRILGSVHDQQDSVIAGAKVTVTDVLRNISRATVTDEAGDYVL